MCAKYLKITRQKKKIFRGFAISAPTAVRRGRGALHVTQTRDHAHHLRRPFVSAWTPRYPIRKKKSTPKTEFVTVYSWMRRDDIMARTVYADGLLARELCVLISKALWWHSQKCPVKVPQHTATHCNTLQHTATHCNMLQHKHYDDTHESAL